MSELAQPLYSLFSLSYSVRFSTVFLASKHAGVCMRSCVCVFVSSCCGERCSQLHPLS